jgi:ELWxxDGT repeat protein
LGFAFTVDDGVHGREPWVSDGSPGGTRLLADLTPGAAGSATQTLSWFGARVLFRVSGGTNPRTLLLDLDGTTHQLPFELAFAFSVGGWRPPLLPDGDALVLGEEEGSELSLWRLDVKTGAASRIAGPNLAGPNPSGSPGFELAGGVVMTVRDELGIRRLGFSDGSGLTTLPGSPYTGTGSGLLANMAATSSHFFFPGSAEPFSTFEPWAWNPSEGFLQLAELGTTSQGPFGGGADCAAAILCQYAAVRRSGDRALFFVDTVDEGRALWASDGTATGTGFLSDLGAPGPEGPIVESYFGGGSKDALPDGSALFTTWATDGIRLWRTNATAVGTGTVSVLNARADAFTQPTSSFGISLGRTPITTLTRLGNRAIVQTQERPFSYSQSAWWTWREDSGAGSLFPGAYGWGTAAALQDRALLFRSLDNQESELWSLDGTSPTPQPVIGLPVPGYPAAPLVASHGSFWYTSEGGVVRTDLVETATFPSTNPWALIAGPSSVLAIGNELSILPVGEGQVQVIADADGTFSSTFWPTAAGLANGWVFNAERPDSGWELWFSDGSLENTRLIRDIQPGPGDGIPPPLFTSRTYPSTARLGESLVFLANDGTNGAEPWITDGTTAQLVADLNPGAAGSWPQDFHQVAGSVLFVADDGTHGRELRVLTEADDGVGLVDLLPGPASSRPEVLATRGPFAYVAAHEPQFGRELWRLDLRDRSLVRLTDLMPGPLPSSPTHLVVIGTTLLFTAHDPEHGFELFQLADPALSIFADGFESGDTTAWVD